MQPFHLPKGRAAPHERLVHSIANSAWSRSIGIAAALSTVLITIGWTLATRSGVTTTLSPPDLAVLRYGVPALVLAPVWLRHGIVPPPGQRWLTAVMVLGGGLPFALIAMAGAQFAPVAHMGALLQGTMPLMCAVLAAVLLKEGLGAARLVGFSLVIIGDAVIAAPALAGAHAGAWRGHALFLAAGLLWALYTVAFRKSGQTALTMAAVIAAWSSILAVPLWWFVGSSSLLSASLAELAVQILWQGVMAGVIAVAAYGVAIRRLGASNAALAGALMPAGTAIGGLLVLGETFDAATMVGIALTTIGVSLAAYVSQAARPTESSIRSRQV
jgi:drug/metabolite transporter (DMT)-like permease